jgi:lysyl-tRNA synthetase class 2
MHPETPSARNEQEQVRYDSMDRLRQLGIDPFPAASFPTTHTTVQAASAYELNAEDETLTKVRLAGRLMQRRLMGKAAFVELQDGAGRVQLYCSKDDLSTEAFPDFFGEVFKPLIDRGDFIGVEGFMFRTKMGEVTLHVKSLTLLGKSLRPLPLPKEKDGEVYDAFTDPEQRYRQRYVDLIVNPQVRETFRKRAVIIETMRRFFVEQGFLEVETPILQPLYGGAAARPFTTHHNTLDMKLYLRIANELYLKRLIVGGFDGVFEFAKDFRNEGMSRFHNPEFTMLELYAAYKDYAWMADFIEEALERVAIAVHGSTDVPVGDTGDKTISFARPWKRVTLYGAIEEATGVDVSE